MARPEGASAIGAAQHGPARPGTAYGLRRLTAVTTVGNARSRRVLERAGFVRTGESVIGGQPAYDYELAVGR